MTDNFLLGATCSIERQLRELINEIIVTDDNKVVMLNVQNAHTAMYNARQAALSAVTKKD